MLSISRGLTYIRLVHYDSQTFAFTGKKRKCLLVTSLCWPIYIQYVPTSPLLRIVWSFLWWVRVWDRGFWCWWMAQTGSYWDNWTTLYSRMTMCSSSPLYMEADSSVYSLMCGATCTCVSSCVRCTVIWTFNHLCILCVHVVCVQVAYTVKAECCTASDLNCVAFLNTHNHVYLYIYSCTCTVDLHIWRHCACIIYQARLSHLSVGWAKFR